MHRLSLLQLHTHAPAREATAVLAAFTALAVGCGGI